MAFEKTFDKIRDEKTPTGGIGRFLQSTAGAIAPFYGVGAWMNRLLHEVGVRERRSLPAVVFSVGNITLGGTGKTPFCIWLAQWLQQEGRSPAVLTRGYGRTDEDALTVVHDGRRARASVRASGDEPSLIAEALGNVPVLACSNRYRAGRLALRKLAVDSFILDDGFQHVSLDRQGEIVLVDATRPLGRLRVFPRGTLREPLRALCRAHLIVLTRCGQAKNLKRVAAQVRRHAPGVPIVRTQLTITGLRNLSTGEVLEPAALKKQRVLLVCGVGNPDSVRQTVRALGGKVAAARYLEDHAWPAARDIRRWEELRQRSRAAWIVTTAKDAVRLEELTQTPENVLVLESRMDFMTPGDRKTAERTLRARLHAGRIRGYLK